MSAVLFVCLGNICRSPAGEGVLIHLLQERNIDHIKVGSCGTASYHIGEAADKRMRAAASKRGIDLPSRAEQFQIAHFDEYDYILTADQSVHEDILSLARHEDDAARVYLMTHFSTDYQGQEVPDPYYGGQDGFDHVLDMLEESCTGLLDHISSSS